MSHEHEESAPKPLEPHVADDVNVGEAVIRTGTRRWRKQYDRMKRARQRTRSAVKVDEEMEDNYYVFFLWCYHLKDWLKNDDTVPPAVRDAVESFVAGNRLMGVCGDLANGVKHLRRDEKKFRVDPNAKLSAIYAAFQPDAFQNDAFQAEDRIVVVVEGNYRNASEVADACIAAWDDFLRTHGFM